MTVGSHPALREAAMLGAVGAACCSTRRSARATTGSRPSGCSRPRRRSPSSRSATARRWPPCPRHGDARAAVVEGVARTARVITAAAIMVAVFAAFALSPEVFLKLMGVGLVTAVLVDATIVRMVLVPAVMQLLGERAWWAPRWLRGVATRPSAPVAAD